MQVLCVGVSVAVSMHPANLYVDLEAVLADGDPSVSLRVSKVVKSLEQALEWVLGYQLRAGQPLGVMGSDNDDAKVANDADPANAGAAAAVSVSKSLVRHSLCPCCLAEASHSPLSYSVGQAAFMCIPSSGNPHTLHPFEVIVSVDYPRVVDSDRNVWAWSVPQLHDYLLAGSDLHRKFLSAYNSVMSFPLNAHRFLCLTDEALHSCSVLPAHRAELRQVVLSLRKTYVAHVETRLENLRAALAGDSVNLSVAEVKDEVSQLIASLEALKESDPSDLRSHASLFTDAKFLLSKLEALPTPIADAKQTQVYISAECSTLIRGQFSLEAVAPFTSSDFKCEALSQEECVFFISHRGPDTKDTVAAPLSWMLKQLHVPHFFDKRMEEGKGSVAQMSQACLFCRVGLVIVSDNFINSSWCLKELNTFTLRHRLSSQQPPSPGSEFHLYPAFYNHRLLKDPAYLELSRLCSRLRGEHEGAFDFVARNLLPALLEFAPIQSLPCIRACREKIGADRNFLARLWNEYQHQSVAKENQHLFEML